MRTKKILLLMLSIATVLSIFSSYSFATTTDSDSIGQTIYDSTGISYQLPQGWNAVDFNTPKDFLNKKFQKGNSYIMIGINDVWSQLSYSEKEKYDRNTLSVDDLGDDFLSVVLNIDKNSGLTTKKETYGDNKCLVLSYPLSVDVGSINVSCVNYVATSVIYGYFIFVQFTDMDNGKYMDDYETLLSSFSYSTPSTPSPTPIPVPSSTIKPTNSSKSNDTTTAASDSSSIFFLIIAITVGVIIVVVIIFFHQPEKKQNTKNGLEPTSEFSTENNNNNSINQTLSAKQKTIDNNDQNTIQDQKYYCPSCGKQNRATASFCKYCGTRID